VYTRHRLAFSNHKLLSIARPVSYVPGARLVRQGEPSKGAFILKKGIVEAQVGLPGGGTLAVAEFRDGDMFGEMALVERGVCTASVFARTGVEGWFVARDDFRAMVASRDPAALEVQREITRVLAGKLRALNARVREHPAAEDRPAHDVPSVVQLSLDKSPSFPWRAFLPVLRFLEGFDDDEIEELVAPARAFELERGAWLFAAGQGADACYLVVRGALEIISARDRVERRVALAGPGELVGYLAVLDGAPHNASARVRESACLLALPAAEFLRLYAGDSGAAVSLLHAIHASLLRALSRTNNQLTRLISAARLRGAHEEGSALEAARGSQIDVVPQAR
jgi:CRP/FNR family transcriptional regulator, cyclic AMP receptor protein